MPQIRSVLAATVATSDQETQINSSMEECQTQQAAGMEEKNDTGENDGDEG